MLKRLARWILSNETKVELDTIKKSLEELQDLCVRNAKAINELCLKKCPKIITGKTKIKRGPGRPAKN